MVDHLRGQNITVVVAENVRMLGPCSPVDTDMRLKDLYAGVYRHTSMHITAVEVVVEVHRHRQPHLLQ